MSSPIVRLHSHNGRRSTFCRRRPGHFIMSAKQFLVWSKSTRVVRGGAHVDTDAAPDNVAPRSLSSSCFSSSMRTHDSFPLLSVISAAVLMSISPTFRSFLLFVYVYLYSFFLWCFNATGLFAKPLASILFTCRNCLSFPLWSLEFDTGSVAGRYWVGLCLLVYFFLSFVYYCLYLCSLPVYILVNKAVYIIRIYTAAVSTRRPAGKWRPPWRCG